MMALRVILASLYMNAIMVGVPSILRLAGVFRLVGVEGARQLVSYDLSGNYHLHEAALSDIQELPSPVLVLAAVGDARIGKSTFLNMVNLHWDPTFSGHETMPFAIGNTTKACTRGVWVYVCKLPEGGGLVLVDVESTQLGSDAVTKQLSALTAVMSSYILLFMREVVNNAALEFLYHTTELGKMFPDSNDFPRLGVAIRDALELDPTFPDRHSEVVYSITSPTHKDGNDEMREVIAGVFPPDKISAFEVAYQDRKQLQNLQDLKSGPFFDSVQEIISQLKKTVSPKSNGMAMRGEDLVKMIRKLFTALESDNITTLETAYERLEKQMCDSYYSDWIALLLGMSEEEFMSKADHHLTEFTGQCKIDSYTERIKQEIRSKREGIIREREEREERRKAEEARKKAEEEERKAQEARRRAEEERKGEKEKRKVAEEEQKKEEERRRRAEADRAKAVEEQRREKERKRQEEAERKAVEERLAREGRRGRSRKEFEFGGFSLSMRF